MVIIIMMKALSDNNGIILSMILILAKSKKTWLSSFI